MVQMELSEHEQAHEALISWRASVCDSYSGFLKFIEQQRVQLSFEGSRLLLR